MPTNNEDKEISKCCGAERAVQWNNEKDEREYVCYECHKTFIPQAQVEKCCENDTHISGRHKCLKEPPAQIEEKPCKGCKGNKRPGCYTCGAEEESWEGSLKEWFLDNSITVTNIEGVAFSAVRHNQVKSFISSLLLQKEKEVRAEMVEILSKAKTKILKKARETDYADRNEYDECAEELDDIIKLIGKQ